MIDLKLLRENTDAVIEAVKKKNSDVDIEHIKHLDEEYRKLLTQVQNLQAERNVAAKAQDIEKGRAIKEELTKLENSLTALKQELDVELQKIPNFPLDNLPVGGEEKNEILRKEGEVHAFDFQPKDHLEIGEKLGIIDVERAVKVSGSRFAYLKGDGVLLELALVSFAMEKLTEKGFIPVIPPSLIRQEITTGLGYWQAGGNENYYLVHDEEELNSSEKKTNPLYLIGTGEHALVPMHMNETLQAKDLPRKYVAFSPCYRREAGTYGKDTRGILRVHQFEKIEMVALVRPEEDQAMRSELLAIAEDLVKSLGLSYQVVQLATGDISFPSAETIDIETWIPSQDKYRETHSISTTTDFQARRLNIKFQDGGEKKFAHILNGTAFAMGRTIIAILENYQQEDGSVVIPEVLRKYMGGREKISSVA